MTAVIYHSAFTEVERSSQTLELVALRCCFHTVWYDPSTCSSYTGVCIAWKGMLTPIPPCLVLIST